MHSFLVALAYMAMIFVPCACAQWGDVLTADWWSARFQRRENRAIGRVTYNSYGDPLMVSVRHQRAVAKIKTLAEVAFVPTETPALPVTPQYVQALLSAQQLKQQRKLEQSAALKRAAAQVAARLAAISEAHRLANTTELVVPAVAAPPAIAAQTQQVMESMLVRKPPMSVVLQPMEALVAVASIAGPPDHMETPTPAELERLYLLQTESSGEIAVAGRLPTSVAA